MSFFGKSRQSDPPRYSAEAAPARVDVPQPAPPPSPVGFETVLGANCSMEGRLSSNTNVRLDGVFTGTLEITGNVLVGETARITADINAKNISIAGAVRGNVTGRKVQLLRTGRIWGDIRAQALTTEEGAFIDGKITMIGVDPAAIPAFGPGESGEAPPAEASAPAPVEASPADTDTPAPAETATDSAPPVEAPAHTAEAADTTTDSPASPDSTT